jgi:hypothetical protein
MEMRTACLSPVVVAAGTLVLLLAGASRVSGQGAGSATLRGTVVDTSGGVLPGVSLTLTSVRTRGTRSATTDAVGGYAFVALEPGQYRLSAALDGFAPWESSEVHLSPGDSLQLDATLAVAGQSEEVTVHAERERVRLDQGAREGLITSEDIQNLSLISRGAMELLRILPGTVVPSQASMETVGFYNGGNDYAFQSVNGMRGTTLSPVLDGAKLTDIGANNGVIVNMNPDMVEEVKVQSGNYSAEYGSPGRRSTDPSTTSGGAGAWPPTTAPTATRAFLARRTTTSTPASTSRDRCSSQARTSTRAATRSSSSSGSSISTRWSSPGRTSS